MNITKVFLFLTLIHIGSYKYIFPALLELQKKKLQV